MPMKATDKAFLLRLPIDMYEFLKELANKDERSVNYEILVAIKDYQEKTEAKLKK